ncbi:uncharacterized protein [Ranitomeya imitator]|uniref:uncharacterized protein isoform X1 n=1 Tax=Ranitomeya imitator TaxID=111125 RepID=UPI0037E8ABD2
MFANSRLWDLPSSWGLGGSVSPLASLIHLRCSGEGRRLLLLHSFALNIQMHNLTWCVNPNAPSFMFSMFYYFFSTPPFSLPSYCLFPTTSGCRVFWRMGRMVLRNGIKLYDVKDLFSDPPLLSMERAATPLLGVPRYGVHVNGFLRRGADIFMWIARRSLTKPNYPGKLDHLAAGGIAAGSGVWETLLKECTEEACIPESLASTARPAGTVSYAYQQDDALYLECQFVFDLEVPESFQPRVGDGEVQEFYLWPLDKVTDAIATQEFKPNCALVVLDFLMRNGHINPDTEKFYTKFMENLHRPL